MKINTKIRKCQLLILMLMIYLPGGCSEPSDRVAHEVGESIGKNVTEFAKGVGSGVDAKLQIQIELSEALKASGVSSTVAKAEGLDDKRQKQIAVYFISTKPFAGTLVAKAVNATDQEIGRATVEVSFVADDAKYVKFPFPEELDQQMVKTYQIDLRTDQGPAESSKSGPTP